MKSRVEKYIRIEDFGTSPTGKTRIWRVWNHLHQVDCGKIKWYGGFRKYCFFPMDDTLLYDADCMRLIADFLDQQNHRHANGDATA
jgi:hypothetical protein